MRSVHCCLFVANILPFAPSCGPCPLYFIYSSGLELQRDVAQINAASADPRVRVFLRRSAESLADPGAE